MRWLRGTVLSVFAMAMLLSSSAVQAANNADVAKMLPKDCWAFAVVSSLNTIQERANLVQSLDIGAVGIPNIPGMAQGATGFGDTLDLTRPIAIVVMDTKKYGKISDDSPEDPSNALLILVPATDSKALIGKVASDEADSAIRPVLMMGQPAFATAIDDYVAIGRSEKIIKAATLKSNVGLELKKPQIDCLNACDVYVSGGISKGFSAYKQEAMAMLNMAMAAADPTGESAKALEKQLDELANLDFGLALNDDGFSFHTVLVPKSETDLEKLFGDMKNVDKSLLSAMPKETFLMAFSGTTPYSVHQEKFGNQNVVSQFFKSMQATGESVEANEAAVKALDAELQKLNRSIDAFAVNLSALEGGDGGYLGTSMILESREPAACVTSIRTIYSKIWEVSNEEDVKKVKSLLVHSPDAETIEGGKVDTVALKMEQFATETEMSDDDKKMFKQLFGSEVTIRFGVVGDNHVLVSFGGGKDRYATAAKMIKAGGANLLSDPGIASSSKKLPTPRSMEGYISVENIMRTIKTVSTAMGEPDNIPFEVPDINAPIAMDASVVENAWRFDFFVPMKLIKGVKKAIDEQAKKEMEAFDEEDDAEAEVTDAVDE